MQKLVFTKKQRKQMKVEIIKKLYKIDDNRFGCSLNEIRETEKKLGIKFPKTLIDFYQQLGKNEKIVFGNAPKKLEELIIDEEGYVEIYIDLIFFHPQPSEAASKIRINHDKRLYLPLFVKSKYSK